jgi:hypothetical protein
MGNSSVVTYGVPSAAAIARKTGREILQAIIDGTLPQPPIAQAMTFWIIEVGDGFAAFEGEPGPHLLNPMGNVHGGWALTLIDSAAGCAGYSLLPAGFVFSTIETAAAQAGCPQRGVLTTGYALCGSDKAIRPVQKTDIPVVPVYGDYDRRPLAALKDCPIRDARVRLRHISWLNYIECY